MMESDHVVIPVATIEFVWGRISK